VLSTREREVVSLLAEGLSTARIAEKLGLAEVTVHKHFRGARDKMGALTASKPLPWPWCATRFPFNFLLFSARKYNI